MTEKIPNHFIETSNSLSFPQTKVYTSKRNWKLIFCCSALNSMLGPAFTNIRAVEKQSTTTYYVIKTLSYKDVHVPFFQIKYILSMYITEKFLTGRSHYKI